ncbi:energy transducer TonB [Polyangium sp. 6x1]|uniref:TonB family protein n=1 Tax=Polyangium sp. 6x1 TaxID=3042689 RepID=UPI00248269F3|nr:energy transducer TonB [Polyangium sp. 6x1]MDI1443461.1 TonB family protein [Polyangium sp. 6x1]
MFESALGRYEGARPHLGTGALLSIAAHALAAVIVFAIPGKKASSNEDEPVVVFTVPKPPALLGSPGPAAPQPERAAQPKTPRPKRPQVPILTNEPPKTAPTEPEPTDESPAAAPGDGATAPDGTGNGGDPNGKPDGVLGGDPNGKGTAPPPPEPPPTNTTLSWSSEMGRPVLIGGPAQPPYPSDAARQRVEGTVIAQCVITTEGRLRDCRILKGHPFLDPAVNATLAQQRYSPLMYGGRPVSVRYVLTFKFKLQ